MAAEYLANAVQNVSLNSPINFTASIPCTRGYVYHEDETGIFILRGIVKCNCAQFATYRVTYQGNIAVPTGGTVGPIAVALAVNNVTSTAIIKVPKGCCFSLSVRSVSASNDPTVTPAPVIEVQNSNLVIDRIA